MSEANKLRTLLKIMNVPEKRIQEIAAKPPQVQEVLWRDIREKIDAEILKLRIPVGQ